MDKITPAGDKPNLTDGLKVNDDEDSSSILKTKATFDKADISKIGITISIHSTIDPGGAIIIAIWRTIAKDS